MKEVEKIADITLTLLTGNDREQFILDNQRAFKYGAMEEFGERDSHFEEDGEIISRMPTAKALARLRGRSSNRFTLRQKCGKHVLPILRKGIFISMLINVNFI